ncbi:MAG: D-alanine--D-alanine ligase [Candidatus Vogelbacteria bacterium]|nr:D-alanine--D-alanine ligase [Candidatus Vogelbacteria bacterium]
MGTIRVGVVRGGLGGEYEVSLKTGGSVLRHLPAHYLGRDILITKDGQWHLGGLVTTPDRVAKSVDVIFNALHGEFGEDGQIQKLFDDLGVKYTGAGHLASAVAMDKQTSKMMFTKAGLKVPCGKLVRADQDVAEVVALIFRQLPPPWVVKPADRGSSVGLFLTRTVQQLTDAIKSCFTYTDNVLVEEYLRGKEATVGVVEGLRNKSLYALLPIEIRRPTGKAVWDYGDKYNGTTQEVCPGNFTIDEKEELSRQAALAHQVLGLAHYSRSDFMVTPRGIYILETNSLPGMTSESLLPKALQAVGIEYPHFLDHVLRLALND